MRIYFFVLDERLVDSESREVERPAFHLYARRGGSWREIIFLEFSKKSKLTQKREDAKGLILCEKKWIIIIPDQLLTLIDPEQPSPS